MNPFSYQDVATKNIVDTNAFTTAGGVVSGDIKLSVGSDLVKSLGCNDLSAGKKFTILLGTDTNMLTYSVPNSGLLLLLLHQFSLRGHFQVSININKYIIESEARTVRRLTKSDIEKVCLESLPENVI